MIKNLKLSFIKYHWVLVTFFVLFYAIQWVNGRFWLNDFKVYYLAMQNFLNGNSIYGIPFGLQSGFYKYTPFALLPFSVFYFIPYNIAASLFYFFIAIAIITVIYKVYQLFIKICNINEANKNQILYLTTLVLVNHFYRELHLGNVNVLLLLLYVVGLELITKDKQWFAGLLMGIGILIKLHFIVLFPVLLIFKKFKASASLIITFLTGLFIPALFLGFEQNSLLLSDWLIIMKGHNQNIATSPDTVYGITNLVLSIFGFQQKGIWFSLLILGIVGALFLSFVIINKGDFSVNFKIKKFTIVYFMAIACIPLITVTDSEHFLFSLPLVMFCMFLLLSKANISTTYKFMIILSFVFYGGNWHDLWGHTISDFFTNYGFLGIGNLMLILLTALLWLKDNCNFKNCCKSEN